MDGSQDALAGKWGDICRLRALEIVAMLRLSSLARSWRVMARAKQTTE
jgi:hypothetical protein